MIKKMKTSELLTMMAKLAKRGLTDSVRYHNCLQEYNLRLSRGEVA